MRNEIYIYCDAKGIAVYKNGQILNSADSLSALRYLRKTETNPEGLAILGGYIKALEANA